MLAAAELALVAVGQPNQGADTIRQIDVENEAVVRILPPGDRDWPRRVVSEARAQVSPPPGCGAIRTRA